jgi:hypothetical protein
MMKYDTIKWYRKMEWSIWNEIYDKIG